jgi:hypothetical protein
MTLPLEKFVRRIRLHILPSLLVKIRHYGILSTRNRKSQIALARSFLEGVAPETRTLFERSPLKIELRPAGDESAPPICAYCGNRLLSLWLSMPKAIPGPFGIAHENLPATTRTQILECKASPQRFAVLSLAWRGGWQ